MTRILFSLPVHEKPEIVRDQVENIRYFCPDSIIAIHISEGASEQKEEFRKACKFDNVLINPSSYETKWCHGLMHTHVSNFIYAHERGSSFEKIVFLSSNEMLIKHGLNEHVAKYAMGCQTQIYDATANWGGFRTDVMSDRGMRKFLDGLELPHYFGGQAEGQFYNSRIFARMARLFIDNFPMGPCGFPSEEIIPPTVAAQLAIGGINFALPITLCDYCTNAEISPELIEQIRLGRGGFYARRIPGSLRSPHAGLSELKGVFSVKRVAREDCELRRYIRGLMV